MVLSVEKNGQGQDTGRGVFEMSQRDGTIQVLVLEDDASISELLNWILMDAGYQVTCVDNLQAARRECAQLMPDVIIADLLLPDGLGSDLVGEVNSASNGNSPISIVMSAVPQARRRAEAAGADLCLTKPFDLAELLESISEMIDSESPTAVNG
jgi:DNA-binding response OmpR family regulator